MLVMAGVAQEHERSDIVATLLPEHNARWVVQLSPEEKAQAVKRLQSAQRQPSGVRAQELAFLLAAYDSDYEKNRDFLIRTLRGCNNPSITFGCNDNTGTFLVVLYERGHKELLEPLMRIGKDSYNAAALEGIGAFYSDVLTKNPVEFLDTLQRLEPRTQRRVCELAGTADGGRMPPADLQWVRKQLRAKGDVAARCLRAVEAANKPE